MSLQFVIGSSGYGKSTYLYEYVIAESMKHPDKNYLFVVPEQFTMQIQKEFVRRHPRGGIFNIDVLSFQRLAYRVFEETGGFSAPVLDDIGKTLVLRKVMENQKGAYRMLHGSMKRPGALDELKSLLSELIQYQVTPAQLAETGEQTGDGALRMKCRDLQMLYDGFFAYLEEHYITSEQIPEVLCRVIDDSALVRGSVLVLDGFTGFTPLQTEVLHHFLRLCEKVIVAVTIDEESVGRGQPGAHELFSLSAKTMETVRRAAKEERVETEKTVCLDDAERCRLAKSEALFFLERNLFRTKSRVYTGQTGNQLHIVHAQNAVQECKYAASQIRRLVREEGYRYQQIAVVCGDMQSYSAYIEQVFAQYEIPVYLDDTAALVMNPMIDTICALLLMVQERFSCESVMRYFRCGLTDAARDEIDLLENYVMACGVRGFSMWEQEWLRTTEGMSYETLVHINKLREGFAAQLKEFVSVCGSNKTTVREKTEALYRVLADLHLQQKLDGLSNAFAQNGDPVRAKEYSQVYEAVIRLLDEYVELLGDEPMSIREYAQIMEAGLSAPKLGTLPPGTDYVVAGDIERTRLADIAVLIFVGVNDGTVPKAAQSSGFLSEFERERLKEADIALAPTARETFFIQRFYLYLLLTKASDRLYVSYSIANMKGEELRPSFLVRTLLHLFPTLAEQTAGGMRTLEALETQAEAMEYLREGLHEKTRGAQWEALRNAMLMQDEQRARVLAMERAHLYGGVQTSLAPEHAQGLYDRMAHASVSRLERYAACPYAFYLQYGLRLKEREVYEFSPIDQGNLFHDALERYENALTRQGRSMSEIEKEERETLADRCIDESLASLGGERLLDTARGRYHVQRMKRLMRRTVWALGEQLGSGQFAAAGYELDFSAEDGIYPVALDEEQIMRLGGRIDRMDVLDEGNNRYIRIIDYKTGRQEFSLLKFYHGLQLQLVVYLQAALRLQQKKHPQKQIIPAGVFYYRLDDPLSEDQDGAADADREQAVLKALRLDGYVNVSDGIIEKMDSTGSNPSLVVPVSYKKDGTLKSTSKVATTQQLITMMHHSDALLKKMGSDALKGKAPLTPYRLEQENACAFCAYGGVCGFDRKLPECGFRTVRKENEDVLWEQLAQEEYVRRGEEHGGELDERTETGH